MSALARALVIAVLTTLVVWALTLDWSRGMAAPLSATAPLPGIAAGFAAAAVTLLLPVAGAGRRRTMRSRRKLIGRLLLPAGAVGGLAVAGVIGGQVAGGAVQTRVAEWSGQVMTNLGGPTPASRAAEGTPTAPAGVAVRDAGARPGGSSGEGSPAGGSGAAGPGGASVKAPAAVPTPVPKPATATPNPSPTADPRRYELTDLQYEPYPEAGAAAVNLLFKDRQLDRPVLAYYDLLRDSRTLTLTLSATTALGIDREFREGPIAAIASGQAGDRLQLRFRLAQPSITVVDDTWSGQTGIRLFFVPGTGHGALTHAPPTPAAAGPPRAGG